MNTTTTRHSYEADDAMGEGLSKESGSVEKSREQQQQQLVTLKDVKDPLSPQNWPFNKK
jgi:hypothetical protein